MIGLDTNVLVRYLVDDEPRQSRRARQVVQRARSKSEQIFLSQIVLCELVWVLAGAYRADSRDILQTLNRLADDPSFVLESRDRVRRAIDRLATGKADFSDYLLGEAAADTGAQVTLTFDRALRDEVGFTLL
jgi:predicted nucleic-acid-binding protein